MGLPLCNQSDQVRQQQLIWSPISSLPCNIGRGVLNNSSYPRAVHKGTLPVTTSCEQTQPGAEFPDSVASRDNSNNALPRTSKRSLACNAPSQRLLGESIQVIARGLFANEESEGTRPTDPRYHNLGLTLSPSLEPLTRRSSLVCVDTLRLHSLSNAFSEPCQPLAPTRVLQGTNDSASRTCSTNERWSPSYSPQRSQSSCGVAPTRYATIDGGRS